MEFNEHRPKGYVRKGDRYLPQLIVDLQKVLKKAQDSLTYDTLCLPDEELAELASVLVEFAEDIHNDIGIWKSLERYNTEYFGTPLPFVDINQDSEQNSIDERRIQHLLWVLYSELNPELILSPTHRDLKQLSKIAADFLKNRFARIPKGSSVKLFLSQPNKFGWDVKKKLIWMGTHSYLFRNSFRNYVEDLDDAPEIPVIDDFVCQETTSWSGLGVIDILASVLDISHEQRSDLRSWYERHQAYYQILANKGNESTVTNIINDESYSVKIDALENPFSEGDIVLGGLIPWDGMWYWSGVQYDLGNLTEEVLQETKNTFVQNYPLLTYRYCRSAFEKAKEANDRQYQEYLNYYGDDLVIYPDGLTMAADHQKRFRLQWKSKPEEAVKAAMDKYKLKQLQPNMPIPRNLLESENGIGVYYNPDEGLEIMTGFNAIISGFKKKGKDLSEEEEDCIRSFIWSDMVSPKFVRRLIKEYGSASIVAVFLIQGDHDEFHIDYLLRRYKGFYYRKRYPHITIV